MKRLLATLVTVGLTGAVSAASAEPVLLMIRDGQGAMQWRGLPPAEQGGQAGAFLYPAPNVAGLLAAILTHAAMEQGAQSAQRSERQQQADAVLAPYANQLASRSARQLAMAAVDASPELAVRVLDEGEVLPQQALVLAVRPVFSLSADQRTLVLDNQVLLYREGDAAHPQFSNVVRVISDPRPEEDPGSYWAGEGGSRLLDEGQQLFAHSLESVLTAERRPPDELPAKTQRYFFGKDERVERGRVLVQACGRVLLRTLRDGLMSVPVKAEGGGCERRYRLS